MKYIRETLAGESLWSAIYNTQKMLKNNRIINGWIKFNDIDLLINMNSVIDDIQLIYDLKCELRRLTQS